MKNVALYAASIIFLVVSLLHFARYFAKVVIVMGNQHVIPIDWSLYAGVVTLVICLWMFFAAKVKPRV